MTDPIAVHVVPREDGSFEALTGLRLTGLGCTSRREVAEFALRRQHEFLGALADMRHDRWFELVYAGSPDTSSPWKSAASITLVLGARGPSQPKARERALAFHASVLGAVPVDTGLYEFAGVRDQADLKSLWNPFAVGLRVAFERRLERLREGRVGLHAFTGGDLEFGALARALLTAPCQARVRFAFRPTRLMPWEQIALGDPPVDNQRAAAEDRLLAPLQALVHSPDQLLLVRIVVESERDPIPGVLAALATDVAGAGRAVRSGRVAEASGFEIVPLGTEEAARLLLPDHSSPRPDSRIADGLARVRHLHSVDQAALAFRLPILEQPVFGLPSRRSRLLFAPEDVPSEGLLLGTNGRHSNARPVAIPDEARARHLYVLGQTGTGKSTFLHNLIMQDVRAGRGVCVIDPHGDLVERVMATMPAERVQDVALVDPADEAWPVGINLLDAPDENGRSLACESLLGLFSRLWPREMTGPYFQYTTRTLLRVMMNLGLADAIPNPPSILSLPKFMSDSKLASAARANVTDQALADYLADSVASPRRDSGEARDYVLSKFDVLLGNPAARAIVGQRRTRLNIEEVIDQQKVLLIRLPSGLLGEVTARFLGFLVLSKVQNVILGRAERPRAERKDFYLYVDEFQNFLTESFTILLAEGRKFGVNLVIANQFLGQLEDESVRNRVLGAIFGNVGTIVAFRVGHEDAATVARQFGGAVDPADLTALPNFNAYVRMLSSRGAPATVSLGSRPDPAPVDAGVARTCRDSSRARYATPVAQVLADIRFENLCISALASGMPFPTEEDHLPLEDVPGISRGMAGRLRRAGIGFLEQLGRINPASLAGPGKPLMDFEVEVITQALDSSPR